MNIHWIQPCIQDYNMIDEVLALATQLKQMEREFMDYCTSRLPSGLAESLVLPSVLLNCIGIKLA